MRALVVNLARLLLWVFFRRVIVAHPERLPATGPVIYVLNHPNGLVDPLFVLAYAGRPVSLLAKEPLFHLFFVKTCLRALDALPVYRARDQANPKQNAATFAAARAILQRGGSIALFPEGTSHSDPSMKPLKTGAARIALGAAAEPTNLPLRVVPLGILYSAKQTFRSEARLHVGEAFEVAHVALTESGDAPAEAVRDLTAQIGAALEKLLVQSDRAETLDAIALGKRLFAAEDAELRGDRDALLDLERRMAAVEAKLRPANPQLVQDIIDRVKAHAQTLEALGVAEHDIIPTRLTTGRLLRRSALMLLELPLAAVALVAALLNLPAYRFIAFVSRRASHGEDDIVATVKLLAALLAYPASWLMWAALVEWRAGIVAGAITLVATPVLGYATLVFREQVGRQLAFFRAFALALFRPHTMASLVDERHQLRDLMQRISDSLPR